VAGASDGRLLVTWSTTPDYASPSPVPATQAISALRAAGADSFGAGEPLAAPDVASPPLATFLPDGRAIAIWAARPNGHDPSLGVGPTSVLRLAERPAGSSGAGRPGARRPAALADARAQAPRSVSCANGLESCHAAPGKVRRPSGA
jgi:hypothetical protein